MVTLTKSQALVTLIWVRFIVGAISWFFPAAMSKMMLIDAKTNPALAYALRLFGVRDVLMGVLIMAPQGDARDQQLYIGVAIDVIASGIAGLAGQTSKRSDILCCSEGLIGASLQQLPSAKDRCPGSRRPLSEAVEGPLFSSRDRLDSGRHSIRWSNCYEY